MFGVQEAHSFYEDDKAHFDELSNLAPPKLVEPPESEDSDSSEYDLPEMIREKHGLLAKMMRVGIRSELE